MYIKEIVIDGFKSYAHRTVINGFDQHFNAITGLNGSGKSNILDAICFLLGITNLSQVRAGNLTELVYKQGQAGVNKASVTIVFNNEDESKSPVGYEQCAEVTVTRQVLLGGKSKYLVNGRVAVVGQVQNLFHSVQLNVNNPHFLIMQGRITKVLNMKPTEILGMVEETAGTRMYEMKKNSALKTIEKKQTKVDEINSILAEEITPKLEKLRNEKQHYLKWSKNNADIERMERFVVASEFLNAQNMLTKHNEEISTLQANIASIQDALASIDKDIDQKEASIKSLSSKISDDFETRHAKARRNEEKLSKEFVKATSTYQNCTKVLKIAQQELDAAKATLQEATQSVSEKELDIQNHSENDIAQQEAIDAEREVARLQEEYQNICAGISKGDETLPDQISKALSDSKAADARMKQAKMKFDHLSKELKVGYLHSTFKFNHLDLFLCVFSIVSTNRRQKERWKHSQRHQRPSQRRGIKSSPMWVTCKTVLTK
jgi:structural maintenance of chromosome 2